MKIEKTSKVTASEVVEAGIISNLISKFSSTFKDLFDRIDSWGEDEHQELYAILPADDEDDTKYSKVEDWPIRFVMKRKLREDSYDIWDFAMKFKGEDDSKEVAKRGVKIMRQGYLDDAPGEDETEQQYRDRFGKMIDSVQQELMDKLYKGRTVGIDDIQEVKASIKVTLKKVTAVSEPIISTTKIVSDFTVPVTLATLQDVVGDDAFVEGMPEGETSYEILSDLAGYDVTEIEGPIESSLCDDIHTILQPLYTLWATCKVLSWNGTGPYSAYLSQSCDMYTYEADDQINYLSRLSWMKCKVAPHPAEFLCNISPVIDTSEPLQILKNAMDDVINAINLVVCNFDEDEQQALYQYLGRWKQNKDYTLAKMEG